MNRRFSLVLVNLCEDACDYGSGASEYLRAAIVQSPELREVTDVHLVFLQSTSTEGVAEAILSHEPDLVGFTAYSWNLAETAAASRHLRRLEPALPIVWGGCSFLHLRQRHDWFDWWDAVDAVAVGPGEFTLIDLIKRLRERPGRETAAQPVAGWVSHDGSTVQVGPPAEVFDSSILLSPYQLGLARRVPRPYVEMARGCIFDCTFCTDAKGSRGRFFHHSAERIAADVAELVKWPEADWVDVGASTANVSDEAFGMLCRGILAGDPEQRLQYSMQLYPTRVRPSHRQALEGIRIGKHVLGLQSVSPATFKPMHRAGSLDELAEAVSILEGSGSLYVSVILGLPGETYESFAQMMNALVTFENVTLSVHRMLVLPGTTMHTRHEELGLSFDPERYYRATRSSKMTADDLRRAQDLVVELAVKHARPRTEDQRIEWTNFDVQESAFEGAEVPHPPEQP